MPFRARQHRPANYRPPAIKIADPYYNTASWKSLRETRLRIDRYTCTVAGCGKPAVVVDHILSRRAGGADSITNTRSLCRLHDNKIKENADGTRRNDGELGNELARWKARS